MIDPEAALAWVPQQHLFEDRVPGLGLPVLQHIVVIAHEPRQKAHARHADIWPCTQERAPAAAA